MIELNINLLEHNIFQVMVHEIDIELVLFYLNRAQSVLLMQSFHENLNFYLHFYPKIKFHMYNLFQVLDQV